MRPKEKIAYQSVSRTASLPRPRSAGIVEDIAHPADRVDQLAVERIVDLGAEAADVDVHDVRPAVEIHVPDFLGDGRARQDLASPPDQERQQGELLGREVELPAGPRRAVADQVDLDIGAAQRLLAPRGTAPE